MKETSFLFCHARLPNSLHFRVRIIYNKGMGNNIAPRVGTFFILIGLGLLILFVGSALSRDAHYNYLLFSAAALFLGFLFRRTAPRPEPTRFSGIRKASQRSRQRREEREQQKKAPKK